MFGKKRTKSIKNIGSSFDRLLNYNLTEDIDVNEQMLELADSILGRCPVLVNFDRMKDTNKCNQVLSFLSGVIYSINGESYQIGKESYLIASDEAFQDGSLHKWIKQFGHDR